MEKMTGHPRLYRRGAVYWHRAAVPVDIQASYPKTEETFSLRTKDRMEALKRVRVEAARVDVLFDEHRRQLQKAQEPFVDELSADQIKRIEAVYYAHLLDEDEETRLSAFEGTSFEEYADVVEALDEVNRHDLARGRPGSFFEDEAREVLSWSNVDIRLAPASPSWPRVIRALQSATIRAAKAKQDRNKGEVIDTPPMPEGPKATPRPSSGGPSLSDLVEEWAAEKARTVWVPKTEHEHRTWMGHFVQTCGDKPLDNIGKAEARAFKATLMSAPANWTKLKELKGKTLAEAATFAKAAGMKPMSDKNVNKIIGFVSSFWTWAAEHYDDCPLSPFRGLKLKSSTHKNVRDERDPFSLDELRRIFAAPIYAGCLSRREWSQPGDLILRDAGIFWVPLIALFTGARAGEIIQLYADDVREDQGVAYFDLNAEGKDKRLKNTYSRRRIPVHRALIDFGLHDLIARRRKAGEVRLFPDCPMGADGYYSSPFSKHFGRFLRLANVKTGKNAFHSFRHCFEDACRNSGIPKEIMDALQGHGEEGMSKRYGKGYVLRKLAEAMGQLRYEDLDLKHLRAPPTP
jgi:integrase